MQLVCIKLKKKIKAFFLHDLLSQESHHISYVNSPTEDNNHVHIKVTLNQSVTLYLTKQTLVRLGSWDKHVSEFPKVENQTSVIK